MILRRIGGLLLLGLATQPVSAADLELKRVMLSTAGVGYMEYAGQADGPVRFQLNIPLEHVDDVLKSIIVFDSAGGVGGIELPPRDNTAAALGDLPFGAEALASTTDYLNALRGVVVEVTGPRPMTGRLLKAEATQEAGGKDQTVPRTRVSILTTDGLRQFVLEDAETVRVADPALRTAIERGMDALRQEAARSSRLLAIRGSGTGAREVRVGYIAGAALWKTSYRLILPQGNGKARLQGWAVLENATGKDWNGVALSLQYGNPVSFRQALYRSYFVNRPEVPVQILGQILPDIDTSATASRERGGGLADTVRQRQAITPPMGALMAPSPAPAAAPAAPIAAPSDQVQSAEGSEDTVFTLATPVVLAAGHTASVPILDREVAATRIGLVPYGRRHPLAAVRVTNDTATSLPAGVLTLYDQSGSALFAGDARLGGLPAGEMRLLSFAEDLRTSVTWTFEDGMTIAAMTAADGVVQYDEQHRWTARIAVAAPAQDARTLLIEIPKRPGYAPASTQDPKPIEETATAWRFPASLGKGERKTLTVRLDRVVRQQVALTQDDRLLVRLLGLQGLDDRGKAGLQRLTALNAEATKRKTERERLDAVRAEADRNQDRIRKNLAAVPTNDAMHGRLVRQLEAEEKRIGDLQAQIERAEADHVKARETLANAIATFRL